MDETINCGEEEEEVICFVENNIVLFRFESIVAKSLVTKKFKNCLEKINKSLKTIKKFELKADNYLICICGEERDKVVETKMNLNKLIQSFRKQKPFTHLITVPFNSEPLRQQFCEFKDNILNNFKDIKGMDESLFQNPFKLHLTFGVLVLLNQNEILLAKQVLRQSLEQIVRPVVNDKPLKVSVEGLDVMNGRIQNAHILYAQIKDDSNRLQSIADQIIGQFVESGLLVENQRNKVKLHITFMNSLFKQRILSKTIDFTKAPKKRIKRETFDAKPIIESYNSFKFCESLVESIQLNDIKTKTEDGFYGCIECIHLPKE